MNLSEPRKLSRRLRFSTTACGLVVAVLTLVAALGRLDAWADWRTLETPLFRVIYKPGYDSAARRTLALLEHYRPGVVALTGNPLGKTSVVIEDIGTMANGFTDPIFNDIHIFSYPADPWSEIGFAQNWWRTVAVHEYIHMAHLTTASGIPRFLVSCIGSPLLPNNLSPGWIIEGITTFGESQLSPYEGRLNDGFFEAYVAARASELRFPSIATATYMPAEYPYFNASYLYGGELFDYLAGQYGKDRFPGLFRDNSSCVTSYCSPCTPCIGLDIAAKENFQARDFSRLYSDWMGHERERSRHWAIDGQQLTHSGGDILSITANGDRLYYVRRRIEKTGAMSLMGFVDILERNLTTGREKTVASLISDLTCPIRVAGDALYYAALDLGRGYANSYYQGLGFISNLHMLDVSTGRDRVLIRDRLRCFAVLEDGRIIYARDRKESFGAELIIWSPQTANVERRFTTDLLIGELNARKGAVAAVARPDWANWNVYLLDLDRQELQPIARTPWKQSDISFAGDRLLFSANYDGIYSCYSFDPFTTKTSKSWGSLRVGELTSGTPELLNSSTLSPSGRLSRLTQGGYAVWPIADVTHGQLLFAGINSHGYDLYRKSLNFTDDFSASDTLRAEKPAIVQPVATRGGYSSVLGTMAPAVHIPILLPAADDTFQTWQAGGILLGADATLEHTYAMELLLPVSTRRPHVRIPTFDVLYSSQFFAPCALTLEGSNSPNLVGLSLDYPLLAHPDHALSQLDLMLDARLSQSGLARKALIPALAARVQAPGLSLAGAAAVLLERRFWGSEANVNLADLLLTARGYVRHSEFDASVEGFTGNRDVGLTTYGYDSALVGRQGLIGGLAFSLPLLQIRWGMWNPNFYIEDLCATSFTNWSYLLAPARTVQSFTGVALELETGWAFGAFYLVPQIGVGITLDRRIVPYFGISGSIPLLSGITQRERQRGRVTRELTGDTPNRLLTNRMTEILRYEFR
jgi:hypothetical protein